MNDNVRAAVRETIANERVRRESLSIIFSLAEHADKLAEALRATEGKIRNAVCAGSDKAMVLIPSLDAFFAANKSTLAAYDAIGKEVEG